MSTKILFVEDDLNLGYLVKENLENHCYNVLLCKNGKEGYDVFHSEKPALCILDIMMPVRDGLELARDIRRTDQHVPILFLTSRTNEQDKLEAFNAGADDYVTKPFSMKELLMRIQAILKRTGEREVQERSPVYYIGNLVFDYTNRKLTAPAAGANETKTLSIKEAELLKVLAEQKNKLISRSEILMTVWGNDDFFIAKSMDVYLTRLRKLLRPDPSLEIQNLYGTGFKLVEKAMQPE